MLLAAAVDVAAGDDTRCDDDVAADPLPIPARQPPGVTQPNTHVDLAYIASLARSIELALPLLDNQRRPPLLSPLQADIVSTA